jgi:hypothetical protein
MITRRDSLGAAILFLWLVGLALLARRELSVSEPEHMKEAALLVVPGTAYYEVVSGDARVGWASATIDTNASGISIRDVIVIAPPDSTVRTSRFAARARVSLTPALRLNGFTYELGGDHRRYKVTGTMSRDTMLELVTAAENMPPDTAVVSVQRNVLWPSTVPLALSLGERPKVGRAYTYAIYDPTTGTPGSIQLVVGAESLFVIPDSAKLNDARDTWIVAHADTVRGWRLDPQGPSVVSGWIDERGRAIEIRSLGTFTVRRTAYELAFQNWSHDAARTSAAMKVHHTSTTR